MVGVDVNPESTVFFLKIHVSRPRNPPLENSKFLCLLRLPSLVNIGRFSLATHAGLFVELVFVQADQSLDRRLCLMAETFRQNQQLSHCWTRLVMCIMSGRAPIGAL